MHLSLAELDRIARYKLLTALVVPRPIALVTTLGPEGVVNAAPYSFFNLFGQEPALVVLGVERKEERVQKDTARNVELTGELVVNLVDEDLAEGMNVCAVDFPPEISEIAMAGLSLAPSRLVRPPRIAEAPAALECRRFVTLLPGGGRELVVAEILAVHIRDGLVDPATLRIDLDRYRPVGRLFGNLYCRTRDRFVLERKSYREWSAERGGHRNEPEP
ncbi:MAG: flavin reductase family protein [Geminicoccaceae bacterium]|nr:flavin reductase family protein [Geminicoccaceae bacterium]MDW8341936.1 flavin reductase family protein [Geminicoccaceae bacterium]